MKSKMKKIAFAAKVLGILALFPVYLIVELRQDAAGNINHTINNVTSDEASIPAALFSDAEVQSFFPYAEFPEKRAAFKKTDVTQALPKTRHKQFNN
jgi:hypothetical protein